MPSRSTKSHGSSCSSNPWYTYVSHCIHVCRTHFAELGGHSLARISAHLSFRSLITHRRRQRAFVFSESKIFPGSQELPRNSGSAKILVGIPLPTPSEASSSDISHIPMPGQAMRKSPVLCPLCGRRAFGACWFAALTAWLRHGSTHEGGYQYEELP